MYFVACNADFINDNGWSETCCADLTNEVCGIGAGGCVDDMDCAEDTFCGDVGTSCPAEVQTAIANVTANITGLNVTSTIIADARCCGTRVFVMLIVHHERQRRKISYFKRLCVLIKVFRVYLRDNVFVRKSLAKSQYVQVCCCE